MGGGKNQPPKKKTSKRPPHSQAYDRENKLLRILETSHRPFWTLSKTNRLPCSGGIQAGSAGEASRSGLVLPNNRQDPPTRDTQRDARRDRLASSGILSGMLGMAGLV